MQRRWTKTEEALARQRYADEWPIPEIAEMLRRSPGDVRRKLAKHKAKPKARPWTMSDDQFLAEHFTDFTNEKIAKRLNRTVAECATRAIELDLDSVT